MSDYWKTAYQNGRRQRYPWDCVVSFVYHHAPSERERKDVQILEVGCGTGSNLWFAAREGFSVAGLELQSDAVRLARERFEEDRLVGDFKVGSFTDIPFPDGAFDLVIDRAALTCASFADMTTAIDEIGRVIKPGGRLFYNCYSAQHSSAQAGEIVGHGTVTDISGGTLSGLDQLTFITENDIHDLLDERWTILSLQRLDLVEMISLSDVSAFGTN